MTVSAAHKSSMRNTASPGATQQDGNTNMITMFVKAAFQRSTLCV